ncbi:flagellar basal-body MS-ring/collar protein FliF [Desulfosoma caldarium]|uniref:Flagellar M-ring protein n=1 Tax=Desulfosoma caldarium TaxID=610254 RepID=A0A3N1VIX5_9BACT|nr:flagellar basal-body MS-ring/collar protein FliF [Desulfosoma caldarium]ROR01870.1 flagellar M-ring protein FliF [Desulfosoma caldarium]
MDRLRLLFAQARQSFTSLSLPQKILSIGSVVLLAASLVYLAYSINRVDYVPLISDLSETDLASIVNVLKEKKITYKLTGSNAVSVPREKLYETRLLLASQGLPRGSGMGFEIFDQQRLGSTEFVQQINYQRALQGELGRTIAQMEEVQECRVHLTLPEEALFKEDQKPARASVFLKLKPGAKLGVKQLHAVAHLVSSAVKGLDPENVTIMSTDGKVFFRKEGSSDDQFMSPTQLEIKNRLEDDLRTKVESMLARVVGADKVTAQVSVELDFSRLEMAEDIYDPDSAVVRSQQRVLENSQGAASKARGNPDAPINIEGRLLQTDNTQPKSFSRQKETVNYEINRVSRQILRAPGTIKKLSVAVIVDGPYQTQPGPNGGTERVFVGRSPQELRTLEDLVKKAVGFDDARGDQVSVSNVAFAVESESFASVPMENKYLAFLRKHQQLLFNVLLTVLVFVFVVRPFMKRFQRMGQEEESAETPPALPEGASEELIEGPRALPLRDQVTALIQENPLQAAQVIRAWMREEG